MFSLRKKITSIQRKRKFLKFYANYVKEGNLCFDIGANIGNRTEVFLDLKAKVICVEPVEESFQVLQNKFCNHPFATIIKMGVGGESGTKKMHISNISEVCTFSENFIEQYKNQEHIDIDWKETRVTKITTLDQLIKRFGVPDFCKIDVEGYELEVLKGLSQPIPLISFEYNAKLKNLALECLNNLSKFQSTCYNFSPYESMTFSFDDWKDETEFREFIRTLPVEVKTGDIYVQLK